MKYGQKDRGNYKKKNLKQDLASTKDLTRAPRRMRVLPTIDQTK